MSKLVMVVDDEPAIRQLISTVLEDRGYQVALAANGLDCWSQLDAGVVPDIILMDLRMPRMGGAELVHTLRQHARTEVIPVVVISGSIELDDFPDMQMVQGYLTKPFDIFKLGNLIDQITNNYRHQV